MSVGVRIPTQLRTLTGGAGQVGNGQEASHGGGAAPQKDLGAGGPEAGEDEGKAGCCDAVPLPRVAIHEWARAQLSRHPIQSALGVRGARPEESN